jgi:hypothetical protein
MTSIDIETLLTIIYVLVDEWYKSKGPALLKGKPGVKPAFSDSEVITLMLVEDFIPYPGEKQFIGYIRANHLALFPKLLTQAQFNRRARSLRLLVEALRQNWLVELGLEHHEHFLIDTKPVPVVGYKRSKSHSDFAGSADYGYCASRNLYYFGYKLVMITTFDGLPVLYELVPANTEERQAAETVLTRLKNVEVFGDKGFLGEEWQSQMQHQTGTRITTPKRVNQKIQHPDGFERLLNSVRERIEGVFHEIQNTGRFLERLLAKTIVGLATRIITKITSHLLRYLLRQRFGMDVQTFEWSSDLAF